MNFSEVVFPSIKRRNCIAFGLLYGPFVTFPSITSPSLLLPPGLSSLAPPFRETVIQKCWVEFRLEKPIRGPAGRDLLKFREPQGNWAVTIFNI